MTELTQAEIELIIRTIANRKSGYEDDKRRCELRSQAGNEYYDHKVRMIETLTIIEAKLTIMQLDGTPDEPPAPVLTAEMAEVLERLALGGIKAFAVWEESPRRKEILNTLWIASLIDVLNTKWEITPTGRAALKAHQASAEGIQAS